MVSTPPSYKGHCYPVEVISHCVWLYFRFPLSFREVEELMLERGVTVSYETVRRWCVKFGQQYADALPRRQPRRNRSERRDHAHDHIGQTGRTGSLVGHSRPLGNRGSSG